jgi:nucleolar MIF4G domain-containing protein 1
MADSKANIKKKVSKGVKRSSVPNKEHKKLGTKKKRTEDYMSSSEDDPFTDFDFAELEDGMSEEDFWARKLGLVGEDKEKNMAKLGDEFAKDGLGDDFLELFDFMEEVKPKPASQSEGEKETTSTGRYIPPHLRASKTGSEGSALTSSRKEVSFLGLLNRVSEGNIDSISKDITTLIGKSRIEALEVAHGITKIACENPNISNTLQGTFAGIVCAIAVETAPSNNYSGSLLVSLVENFRTSLGNSDLHRKVTNIIRFMSFLFSLGLFPVDVIEALIKHIASETEIAADRRIEWILTCLRFSGRVLKDLHKTRMSSLLDFVTSALSKEADGGKKMEFALKELAVMKEGRSNFRAIDHLQTIGEWLAICNSTSKKFKTGSEGSTLHGWRVPREVEAVQLVVPGGDVFSQNFRFTTEWTSQSTDSSSSAHVPVWKEPTLAELAAMNRMNTEVKKNTFMAIMGAVDSKHALIRLDEFGLMNSKNCSQVVGVIVHCALQERKVNKFYLDLIRSLCADQRDGKLARKFSISFKIEFSRLITGGKLDQAEVAVLSSLIAFFIQISNGAVTMADILKPRNDPVDE